LIVGTNGEPKVKGVTLRSALQALERLQGSAAREAAIKAMPAELADAFRYGTIIASRWYPMRWYCDLHSAIVSTTSGSERIIREVERDAARADMTGVYSFAFKLLSPQTLIGLANRLFSTYYDTGTVETLESRKGYVRIRWVGCTGFSRNTWVGIFASCELLLELAGAQHIRVHVRSGGGAGDDWAEAEAYWS
jgi:hypothetical protein